MNVKKQNECYLFCNQCLKTYFIKFNEIQSNIDNVFINGICSDCNYKLVEIDKDILDVIILLNAKGYKTINCCSGHEYENNTDGYIQFENASPYLKIFKTLPKSWFLEKPFFIMDDDNVITFPKYTIRQTNKIGNHFSKQQLDEVNKDLLDWVINLPYFKDLKNIKNNSN